MTFYLMFGYVYAQPQNNTLNPQDVSIPLHAPIELDGKTRQEILSWRTSRVLMHKELILGDYKPTQEIFGQIQDNKPWWGIEGQFCYGPQQQGLLGNSEESRFLGNRFSENVFLGKPY